MSTAASSFKYLSCLVHGKLIGINSCVEYYLKTLQQGVLFLVGLKLSMQDDFNENQNHPCDIGVFRCIFHWIQGSNDDTVSCY